MKNILSHLVVAAIAAVLVFAWNGGKWRWRVNDIVVSNDIQDTLAESFRQAWHRPASAEERQALIDDYVRDELAYREAVALGIGQDNAEIRSTLRALIESPVLEAADREEPTDEQLIAWLQIHPDEFLVDRTMTLRQVYFDAERNTIGADASARFMLGQLQNDEMPDDISQYGDASPVPNDLDGIGEKELAGLFGVQFSIDVARTPAGQWSGPMRSDLGLHLVYVRSHDGGRTPELVEARDAVLASWREENRRRALAALYDQLRERYDVLIADGK